MPSHPSPYYIRCTSRTQRTYRYQCWLNPSYLTLLPCNVGPVGFVVFAPVERRRDHALRETDKLFDASHVLPTAVAKYQVPRLVLRTRGPRRVLLGQLLILSCRVVYTISNTLTWGSLARFAHACVVVFACSSSALRATVTGHIVYAMNNQCYSNRDRPTI